MSVRNFPILAQVHTLRKLPVYSHAGKDARA
jgi:hypothetical protein